MDLYQREGGANQSIRRKTLTTCPKISITYLEVKMYCPNRHLPPPSEINDQLA